MQASNKNITIHTGFIQIWESISIISIILECSSIYFFMDGGLQISSNMVLVIGFLPLAAYSLLISIASARKRKILCVEIILYLLFVAVYASTLGSYELINFAMKFLMIFPCILLYSFYLVISGRLAIYIKRFITIMVAISIISLIIWIIGPLMGMIQPTSRVSFIWGSMTRSADSYFGILFTPQKEATFINIWRNTAFFTEAPKYCLLLTIAFLFELYYFKRKHVLVILGCTIISTFAYTGMIAIIIYFFTKYTLSVIADIKKRKVKVRTITWPVLMAIGIVASYFLLFTKLDTSSGIGRLGDYIVCFTVGMKHPIFGYGFLDNEYLNTVLHASRLASGVGNTMGLSNSLSQVFIDGGIYLVLFYFVSIFGIVKVGRYLENKELFSIGVVLIYSFITTYFAYSGLMFFLLSCGYSLLVMFRFNKHIILKDL